MMPRSGIRIRRAIAALFFPVALAFPVLGDEEPPLLAESTTDAVLAEVLGEPASRSLETPSPSRATPVPRDLSPAKSTISWRTRYELGAGDVLNFGMSGKPTLVALQVPVAPDGTISYLQAKRVSVLGKTIGELRSDMELILSTYHKNLKLIVTPAKLGSKKYTIMGQVQQSGTFMLDRPVSLIEAIAKSKGIAVGITNDSAMELADFRRSFVVRNARKLAIDLEKLYLKGDLTQNIQIEPGDYIYIASKLATEYYVFGAVTEPGLKHLSSGATVTGAIADSQGFSRKAWKSRVLIVRGSITDPQCIPVDMADVLQGKIVDVPLVAGDIIYVHTRPWAFAEDVADVAIKAFIDGAVTGAIYPESVVLNTGSQLATP